jgi:hypothetical protein
MSDPHEWTIQQDRDGFYLEDEYGDQPDGFYCLGRFHAYRYDSYKDAKIARQEHIDNYEPPTGTAQDAPDFAGFAKNH